MTFQNAAWWMKRNRFLEQGYYFIILFNNLVCNVLVGIHLKQKSVKTAKCFIFVLFTLGKNSHVSLSLSVL